MVNIQFKSSDFLNDKKFCELNFKFACARDELLEYVKEHTELLIEATSDKKEE